MAPSPTGNTENNGDSENEEAAERDNENGEGEDNETAIPGNAILATAYAAFFFEDPVKREPPRYVHAVNCIPLEPPSLYRTPVARWEPLGYHDEFHKLRVAHDALCRYTDSYLADESVSETLVGSIDPDLDYLFNHAVYSHTDILMSDILKSAYDNSGFEQDPSAPDFVGYRRTVLHHYILGDSPLYNIMASAEWEPGRKR